MSNLSNVSETERDVAERVGKTMYANDAAAKMLGITLDEIAPGFAKMSMRVTPDMLNGHGILHGGMTFTLSDTAFAYACNSRNQKTVALACTITYVIAGKAGEVMTAVAQEQAQAGRTGVFDIKVTNQNGETVAMFRGNSYRTSQPVFE